MKVRKNADLSPSKLVIDIMHDLKDSKGISLSQIIRYASRKHGVKAEVCKVPLELALKRGVEYNTVNVKNGLYRLNESFFNPFDVLALQTTGECGKRLKYMGNYFGGQSKGCSRRAPQRKTTKTASEEVMLVVKEKDDGGDGGGGETESRCRWCKKLIRDKGKQSEFTGRRSSQGKVQRRSMKKSRRLS